MKLTDSAAAMLRELLRSEPGAEQLGFKIQVTTTGCNSYSYALAITEQGNTEREVTLLGIPFWVGPDDDALLKDLIIDCNPLTGRLQIFSFLPEQGDCPRP